METTPLHLSAKPQNFTGTLESLFEKLVKEEPGTFESLRAKASALNSGYVQGIDFDPLQAKYANHYTNDGLMKLNDKELELLKKNGFVVSERLGTKSFGEGYLAIYNQDLPVFITADSLLHCWHYSYDKILEKLETSFLKPQIASLLISLHTNLLKISKNESNPIFNQVYDDTQFFLLVALYLLRNSKVSVVEPAWLKPKTPEEVITSSNPSVNARLEETIKAIEAEQMQKFRLFDKLRDMDFSQFKPRGHYEKEADLQRYFKCMMWLGRIDLRIAGGDEGDSSLTELGSALFMFKLISSDPAGYEKWKQFDEIMQGFIGNTDSLTFRDIHSLQGTIKDQHLLRDENTLFSVQALQAIQQDILASDLGKQTIMSHIYECLPGQTRKKLPRAWTFMGQRFTLDSWVLSKLVFPFVQIRHIPSCVDVGYSVFKNESCAEIITDRAEQREMRWRDDADHAKQLEATQKCIQAIPEEMWGSNLYTLWLKAIRTLSNASQSANFKDFPQAMKTKAWAHHDLNTQMASWTQLRHDTVLYVKQSYGAMTCCDYPFGFVDPRVEFWDVLIQLGEKMKELSKTTNVAEHWATFWISTIKKIKNLAEKQLKQVPFTEEESIWIKRTIAKWYRSGSGAGWVRDGWYCDLFFGGSDSSEVWDALIADVHTAPPSEGFPGTVLSEAVGNVNMLVAALDNGKEVTMYAGPVFSHYEIVPGEVKRFSDSEWKGMLPVNPFSAPGWTEDHVVGGVMPNTDLRIPTKETRRKKY